MTPVREQSEAAGDQSVSRFASRYRETATAYPLPFPDRMHRKRLLFLVFCGAGCVGNEAAYLLHLRGGNYACRIRAGPDGDRMRRLFT